MFYSLPSRLKLAILVLVTASVTTALAAETASRYVRQTGGAGTVIVFVHGVLGDGQSTWINQNAYWPSMLQSDPTFEGAGIFVYSYPTAMWANMSIDELAENMRLHLNANGVTEYQRLAFLAHSMGGLVLRAYLLKNRDIAARTLFAYFFSTPTTGSHVASLASLLSRNPQFGKMKPMNPEDYLADLLRQWLAAEFIFPSYCAYEKQNTYGMSIVTIQSASNLCTRALDPIDADHINIVKPSDQGSGSYLAFKAAFMKEMAAQRARSEQLKVLEARRQDELKQLLELSQLYGVTNTAVKNFLRDLGEENVAPEDLDSRLRQIAARHRSLERQVQQLPGDDPAAAPFKRQATRDIEVGAYDRAEALLVVERAQIRALELIQSGQSEQAVVALTEAERRLDGVSTESSTDVRLLRGYLYKNFAQALSLTGEKGRSDQYLDLALKTFEPIKNDPKLKSNHPREFASAINGIGNIHLARGQYREAIADFQLATSLVPDYAYAWHDMFVTYFELAKRGEVDLKAMRQALNKTRETGLGLPTLDAKYIASLEAKLADLERSSGQDRTRKRRKDR
jgi:tetratricopeptide (TPR) repeat protein